MTDILQTIETIISKQSDFKINAVGGAYFLEESKIPTYPKTLVKQHGKMLIYSFDVENSNQAIFPIFNAYELKLTSISEFLKISHKGSVGIKKKIQTVTK